jgi:hypothetical protein
MIIYYTALAKGINPDQNLIEALNAKNNFAKDSSMNVNI